MVILCSRLASAQISPGPLSRAHRELEGPTKCATCHNFGIGTRGFKCLECHPEIRRRVDDHSGYHGRVYNPSSTETDCARCHREHNGRQYPLTRLERRNYEHRALTGFALEGKHGELTCERCHEPGHIAPAARAEVKLKDLKKTFLGLSKECATCHKDPHAGQLGGECVRCHSQDAWKPAAGFDHATTAFPLTGLHRNVACEKCHGPKPGDAAAHYKGLTFSACQNCHNDPHRGAFQDATFRGGCQSCHTTSRWKTVSTSSGFDHQKTNFPLHGKHTEISCAQCHKTSDFRQPVAHALCRDCHEDVHQGQFEGRAAGSDCSACHSEVSFKPSLFTRDQHQQSAFRLEGKHASIECEKCHAPAGRDAVYKLAKLACMDCHADPHGGEFAAAPYTNRCDLCHTQQLFSPSTFSSARHAQTKFALTNAHAAVLCIDCHKPLPAADSAAARQYRFATQTCQTCHVDPHKTDLSCETCHTSRQWKELRPFDHTSTRFSLEGAHQTVTCIGCHKPAASSNSVAKPTADFSHTPGQCSDCHEEVHGGQFMAGGREQDCSACHSVTKWSAGSFDHNTTRFPLDGSHIKVRCAQCHKDQMEVAGRVIRVYRGTPTRCVDCHGPNRK